MLVKYGLYSGHLLVKNKALGAGKRYRTTRFVPGLVTPTEDLQLEIDVSLRFSVCVCACVRVCVCV